MKKSLRLFMIALSIVIIAVSVFIWWWRGDFRYFTPEQALRSLEKRYLLPLQSEEITHYHVPSYRCYSMLGALNTDIYIMEKDGVYWHGDVTRLGLFRTGIDADVLYEINGVHIIPSYNEEYTNDRRNIMFYMITDDAENIEKLCIYGKPLEDICEYDGYYTGKIAYDSYVWQTQDEFYKELYDNMTIER